MSNSVDWSKAPDGAEIRSGGSYYKRASSGEILFFQPTCGWVGSMCQSWSVLRQQIDYQRRPTKQEKSKTNDTSVSIANLLNAQEFIGVARKTSEFSSNNAELADQADAILQAIIDNLKTERIPAEASFHLANAQNELSACAKLLECDKTLSDAVFCIGEKLAGIRKGDL